jgi:hypothetical protein
LFGVNIQDGAKRRLLPIKPVVTRWNTLEAMMERRLQIRPSIDAIIMEEVVGMSNPCQSS